MTWKSKKWCWKEQSSNTKMYKCICKKRDGSLFCHLNFSFAAKADRTRSWSKNRFQVSFRYIQFQMLSPIQLSLYTHSASSQQGSWIALCGLFVTGSFCSSDRQVWITWTQPERTTKQTKKPHKHYTRVDDAGLIGAELWTTDGFTRSFIRVDSVPILA